MVKRKLLNSKNHDLKQTAKNPFYLLLGDLFAVFIALCMAWFLAYIVQHYFWDDYTLRGLASDALYSRAIQISVLWAGLLTWFSYIRHYDQRIPFWTEVRQLLMAVMLVGLVDSFFQFLIGTEFSALWLILGWFLSLFSIILARIIVKKYLRLRGRWQLKTLVIGRGGNAIDTVRALESEKYLGYHVVAIIDVIRDMKEKDIQIDTLDDRLPIVRLGQDISIKDLYDHYGADFVVVALDSLEVGEGRKTLQHLTRKKLPYALSPPVRGMSLLGLELRYFFSHDVMLLVPRNNLDQPLARCIKRVFDLCAAVGLLIVLSPLFIYLTMKIRSDGGAAFFAHERIGFKGKKFPCLKFRTMVMDADKRLEELLKKDPAARREWEQDQKLRDDPRITKVGDFLRRTSLDELAQLINVLKGEMSLVGPRPIVDDEIKKYGDKFDDYIETVPGITGLWQVSGRNNTTYERRVELDSWYVRNWSLWLDIAILFKTIPALLKKEGSY